MNEAAKQRIMQRIAERKRLGLTAEQFDGRVRQEISDASREMQLQIARSFQTTYLSFRNSDDPVAAAEYRRRAAGAKNAAVAAETRRLAAVEYAKKFGAIVSG
jgi:hypothetical protein